MSVDHGQMATQLREAYRNGAIPPLRDGLEPTDAVGAYAVQQINTEVWKAEGRRVIGRKIGLTSEAVQKQLGVDQPDFGVLFDNMLIGNGKNLLRSRVLQPRAEAEVAFILARDLNNPVASAEDVFAATESAVAAIEIVDSRIADWKITFADTVADNGSSAFFVLGDDYVPLNDDLDLYTCGMAMEVNGKIVSLGAGAACWGHPLNAAAWLVRKLSNMGEGLKAGDILLSGALGPMVSLTPGDAVVAKIGGLGRVGFTYLDDRTDKDA